MYAFSFKNSEKIGEKKCFYTKEADLSFENFYKNHFFFQSKSQAKILNFDAFFGANKRRKMYVFN